LVNAIAHQYCIGFTADEFVQTLPMKEKRSSLLQGADIVLVLAPLLAMVVAQEIAHQAASHQVDVISHNTLIGLLNTVCHNQVVLIILVQSGLSNSHHKYKSFSIYALQLQLITSFILIEFIVNLVVVGVGVSIKAPVVLA